MGRYFRTSTPQNIDFMYKLPEDLMMKATQQASNESTQQQSAIYSLYDKLKLQALSGDKQRAKEILGGYENQINDLASELQSNPLDFRRKTGSIINLSRSLTKDFTTGEAAGINNNYALMSEWEKRQLENKDIKDKESIYLAKQKWLNDYARKGGLKWDESTGTGQSVPTEELYNTVDVQAKYDKYAKDKMAKIMSTATALPNGKYRIEEGHTVTEKTSEEIMSDLHSRFLIDDESQNYLKQRSSIGAVNGWYNEDKYGNATTLKTDAESGFASLLTNSANSYKQHDVTGAYKRMKADEYQLKKADDNNTLIVNPSTGEYNTPQSLPATDVAGLSSYIGNYKDQNKELLTGVTDGLYNNIRIRNISPEKKAQLKAKVDAAQAKALQTGNTSDLDAAYTELGIEHQPLIDAKNQIKYNEQRAYNHQVQLDYYTEQAKAELQKKNPTVTPKLDDINALADAKMKTAKQSTKATLIETNGEGMQQSDEIQKGLKQLSQRFDAENFPTEAVIQTTDKDGKVTQETVTGVELANRLKVLNKTTSPRWNGVTQEFEDVERDGKPRTKRDVSKVLQSVGGIYQPYKVKYDASTTVFIDPKKYPIDAIEEGVSKNSGNINLTNAIQQAKNDALGLRDNNGNFEESNKPKLKIGDNMYYVPASSEDGTGQIMIDFGHEITYKMDGKTITSQYLVGNENKQAILDKAVEIMSKN